MNYTTRKEVWKDIKGYEGYYQVSDFGRVRSVSRSIARNNGTGMFRTMKGFVLKQTKGSDGHFRVTLSKNGKRKLFLAHRLVAEAFIPNPEYHPFINHIDEVKSNNLVSNLEWCDNEYNSNYGSAQDSKKKAIRATHIKTGKVLVFDSMMDAQRSGFQQANISKVCKGERNKHKGYKWEYIN